MKVFVTGATGFVGREMVRQLHAAGHSVRILARSRNAPRAQEAIACWGAEVHPGNVLEAATLDGALKGIEAVIHLVGIIAEVGESTFERVHTHGTRNILAAAQQAGVRRFIHMSALGTRLDAASRYHQTKWAAEELVRRAGVEFTIFRPSLIYGPQDQFVNLFGKIIRRSPIVPLIGGPRARFQPILVEVVAAAFVRSLREPKSVNQVYDLCGPERLTLSAIVDQMLAVLQKRRLKFPVPSGLAWCQAACMELVFQRLLRKPSPLNRDQLVMLHEDNVGDPQPANELLGLRHPSFRAGIARYLGWDARNAAARQPPR
ncbi:MAG TPA: complex I NDUFA9 subunit family protein [Verrucomicrobiota bacterium]|nr:complex I NDUFA9 subunit family protein [Verrucomicrobiota bacterium]HQL77587.1 complex I NDUFA9 subunit family protein [Verrucomicrobiota bacterium]